MRCESCRSSASTTDRLRSILPLAYLLIVGLALQAPGYTAPQAVAAKLRADESPVTNSFMNYDSPPRPQAFGMGQGRVFLPDRARRVSLERRKETRSQSSSPRVPRTTVTAAHGGKLSNDGRRPSKIWPFSPPLRSRRTNRSNSIVAGAVSPLVLFGAEQSDLSPNAYCPRHRIHARAHWRTRPIGEPIGCSHDPVGTGNGGDYLARN